MMKKLFLLYIILISGILNVFNSYAKLDEIMKQSWRWRSYDINDGLPSKNIYDLIVTPKGIIWAVTGKGLCYFNNYYWVKVGSEQTNNKPWLKINHDQADGLFCIDYSYNVYHVTQTKIDTFDLKFNNKHINIIDIAAKSKNKIIFIGFFDNDTLAYMFQKVDGNITLIENSKMKNSGYIVYTNKLLSTNNYNVYVVKDSIMETSDSKPKIIFSDSIYDFIKHAHIYNYGNNKLIFLTGKYYIKQSVWEYDFTNSKLKRLMKPDKTEFIDITISSKGEIIVLENSQKLIYRNTNGEIEKLSLDFVNTTIFQVRFDHNDNLWIRTDQGVYFINIQTNLWTYIKQTNNKFNDINSITKINKNEFWYTTGDGILIDSNSKIKTISSINNIKLNITTDVCKDSSGNIWVVSGATFKGAFKFDGKSWYYYGKNEDLPYQNYHKAICDYKGNVWFLPLAQINYDSKGLYFFDGNQFNEFGKGQLYKARFYDMVFDSSQYVFGTSLGIYIYKDEKIKLINNLGKYNTTEVFTLALDSSHKIWFAGRINTPGYIDSNLIPIYPETFFSNEVKNVWNIKFDKIGKLWLASRKGLFIYHNGIINQFDQTNGLSHSLLWPILIDNEKVYIGTTGAGISVFDISYFNKNNDMIIKLKSMQTNNDDDDILFGLELFSQYLSPINVQKFFRYKIDNEKFSEWELWYSKKTVFAKDIDEGKHILYIEAMSGLDYNKKTKVEIPFEISKSFFKSKKFKIIILSISFFIILTLYLIFRLKFITKAKELIEEKNRAIIESSNLLEKQKEIISNQNHELMESLALRTKMISIISHDIKNPLSLLARNSEMMQISSNKLTREELNVKLENNLTTVNKIASLLDDMLEWARNQASGIASEPQIVDFEFLISKIKKVFNNSILEKKLNFITDIENNIDLILDENMLESVLRNLISNAIKFTPENGVIQIKLSENEYYYIIIVQDSGVGMDETQLSNLFKINVLSTEGTFNEKGSGYGLVIAKEFVGWHGGLLEVQSKLNLGTKFIVKLPKLLASD